MDVRGKYKEHLFLLMDMAYEHNYTKYIAQTLRFKLVVPPKKIVLNHRNMIKDYIKNAMK